MTSGAAQADGKLLVGGEFQNVSGQPRGRFLRLNTDGTVDTTPAVGVTSGARISSIFCDPDGSYLVGGSFTAFGGEMHGYIAHVLANGTVNSGFTTNANADVLAQALLPDGGLMVGGSFSQLGGAAHLRIARLLPTGLIDPTFNASANNEVFGFAVQPDGKVLISGRFTQVNNVARRHLARLNADGTLDEPFNPDPDDLVGGLSLQPDGKILVAGIFNNIGGAARARGARLNADGTLDAGFNLPANTVVAAMAQQADGKIVIGGAFSGPGSSIIRVNADGTMDNTFTPVPTNNPVHVVLDGTGHIYAAGSFSTIQGQARTNLARITNPTAPTSLLVINGGTISLTLGGSSPVPSVVFFESSVDGATWVDAGVGTLSGGAWQLTGVTLPGGTTQLRATGIVPTNGSDSGLIRVTGSAVSGSGSRLLNISTRAQTGTGDAVLIPGFVIGGTGSKQLLIRAIGPTLALPAYGVTGALADPRMTLKRFNPAIPPSGAYEDVTSNDEWGTNTNAAEIGTVGTALGAFTMEDAHESALLLDLEVGQYTVVAEGVGGATGIAIVEVYDADAASPSAQLLNISNRGFAGEGAQVMIPGFVISAEGPKTVLLRVVGPGLNQFGVTGTMADPKLTLFRQTGGETLIATQDNWSDHPDAGTTAAVAAQVQAFALTAGSTDAALVTTLQPGAYTVVGESAVPGSTGVVLVELYVVP